MQITKVLPYLLQKGEAGFDEAIMATLFNKREPNRRPDMMVTPRNVAEIIATIKQAKALGKKISICSGGHSWSANHVRNGSILINMRHFNQYEIDAKRMMAKAGPAVGGSDLLCELFKKDLFFPAGHCKGVCIGGYLLQGGFAWNGRKLGMACESVLAMDIVTAEGELVHASPLENQDLYWAARGSGGGFFGVVVCFYLKLHKKPKYAGSISHIFNIKYLEEVYNWAHEVGPSIPNSVEFQLIMTQRTLHFLGAGIEVLSPIFADSKAELAEACAFMQNSPIKKKAYLATPYFNLEMKTMYNFAMLHYPDNHHWSVDNMWTSASIDDLMPYLKEIAATLPPPPAHFLWLNWHPPIKRQDMAFSMEDKVYLALYGAWKSPSDSPLYENWASKQVQKMAHFSTGIQLADEGLHKRTDRFVSDEHLLKLDEIRSQWDKNSLFNAWHSRPQVKEKV